LCQMSRSRSYVFTINNYTGPEELQVQGVECDFLVYGREVGKEGTPHLQGFVKFANARSFKAVSKLLPRAHVEVCRDVGRAILYCRKDGDVFEKGVEPEKNGGDKQSEKIAKNKRLRDLSLNELVNNGEISILDVRKLKNARLDLAQENPQYTHEDTRGVWIWGPPGVGKTHAARAYDDVIYIKSQNKWWDGYQGEKTVVLDDFDCKELGHYIKIWADKWACSGEVKGGTVNLQHTTFIITSNYPPSHFWCEDEQLLLAVNRRFRIIKKDTL